MTTHIVSDLSPYILFFRIPVKAAPVRATRYVRLGSLIGDIGVFVLTGWNKALIAMKVNLRLKFISFTNKNKNKHIQSSKETDIEKQFAVRS